MGGHIPQRLWPVIQDQVRGAIDGLARARPGDLGGARRAQALRVLEADVLGGARPRRAPGRARGRARARRASGSAVADEIRADILAHGVSERGVFRQHYETDALDASTLLIPLVRFLPPDDERVRATVLAIADELQENGFVLRYRVEETDDGLSGEEGTFLICSFWLVSALSEIGEASARRAAVRAAARARLVARPVRRGARGADRPAPRQLPAGVHPPGADQRGDARDLAGGVRGGVVGPRWRAASMGPGGPVRSVIG